MDAALRAPGRPLKKCRRQSQWTACVTPRATQNPDSENCNAHPNCLNGCRSCIEMRHRIQGDRHWWFAARRPYPLSSSMAGVGQGKCQRHGRCRRPGVKLGHRQRRNPAALSDSDAHESLGTRKVPQEIRKKSPAGITFHKAISCPPTAVLGKEGGVRRADVQKDGARSLPGGVRWAGWSVSCHPQAGEFGILGRELQSGRSSRW
ncbi:hypothetical protein B0J12DRAFT_298569 [Macrophomina phaseolina]|uniref:Uncharacterized protein n=1 Tax=Macrophomina phaseolina TaxID=35725 RepID=A0ABQ8GP29_9PEZI|nr:hypothetical protein B0J12DRAFT_298569 [Macrophomina phaseolina]